MGMDILGLIVSKNLACKKSGMNLLRGVHALTHILCFLAILFLTVVTVDWAGSPTGPTNIVKNNYYCFLYYARRQHIHNT